MNDLRQQGIFSQAGHPHFKKSGFVDTRPDHFIAGFFFHRNTFTGQHRFING